MRYFFAGLFALLFSTAGVGATDLTLTGAGGPVAGGGGFSSFAFCDSSTTSSTTATIPVACRTSGFFALILNQTVNAASPPSTVVPSGFTTLINAAQDLGSTGARIIASAKKLDGTETTVSVMSASQTKSVVLVFEPDAAFTSFDNGDTPDSEITGSNPSAQSINATGGTDPAIVWCGGSGQSDPTLTASGLTIVTNSEQDIGYEIQNGTQTDRSCDMDDVDSNSLFSGFINFTE